MIGILCGLKSEAKIADKIPHVLVGCSAAKPDRARVLVEHMLDQGVTRLISFGLAGATGPDMAAGDLLLGATVMSALGAWEADADWNQRVVQGSAGFMCVPVWGSDRMASGTQEKEAIYRRAGCLIVDMESHIVAQAAALYRVPFNIVRAVTDTASMVLPPAAKVPLLEDGGVDLKAVFSSVVNQPSQLIDLIHLGHNTSLALRALKQAVAVIKEMEE